MIEQQIYRIALTLIPKVGSVLAKNLVGYCGGVEEVFKAKKKTLLGIPGIGTEIAKSVLESKILDVAEREYDFCERHGIRPIFYLDKEYPSRLKNHDDSPIMLYHKGNSDLNHGRMVGIVGTRNPSERGRAFAEQFVKDLKQYNAHVISGLAYGIDIVSHKSCVEENIPTIGVVGHGLRMIYPSEHRQVAKEMTMCGGLLSEYPSETLPKREHFPMRNRIIAGMCDALVVVETDVRGGSMITAQQANDYNKDVLAVPGRIKDAHSRGCNLLIKSHRASLMEGVEDLAYLLRWENNKSQNIQPQLFIELSPTEKKVTEVLKSGEPISIDQLIVLSEMSMSVIAPILLALELKGVIKGMAGKRYLLL